MRAYQNPNLSDCLKAKRVEIEWPDSVIKDEENKLVNHGKRFISFSHYDSIIFFALSLPGAVVKILEA